jgi:hypothetical protein
MESLPGLRVGALSPSFQAKLIPAEGKLWGQARASRTLVLRGEVKIVAEPQEYCDLMNQNVSQPRMFVKDFDGVHRLAFSQDECNRYLSNNCAFKEVDWELDFNVMSRSKYLDMYF